MAKAKQQFENEDVKHSLNCHSSTCLVAKPGAHVCVHYFITATVEYYASSFTAAARMWAADGQKDVIQAGSIG